MPTPPPTDTRTDLQKFLDLMQSFGVEPAVEVTEPRFLDLERETIPGCTVVSFRTKEGGVGGYPHRSADFEFTEVGSFEQINIWDF